MTSIETPLGQLSRRVCSLALPAMVLLLGCGSDAIPAPEPPEVPVAEPASGDALPGDAQAAERPASAKSFQAAWSEQSPGWNHAVVIAPWGDVIAQSMHALTVHARDTGKILSRTRTCSALRIESLGFTGPQTALLACDRELWQIEFPTLKHREVARYPWRAECGSVRGELVVVANEKGPVLIYDASTFAELDRFDAGGEVESVAAAPSRRQVAVGLDDGTIQLRDLDTKTTRVVHKASTSVGGLRFSPDGEQLFGEVASFTSAAIHLADGSEGPRYRLSSWLQGARYLPSGLIAASGAHGLSLLSADGSSRSLSSETGEGLGISPNGSLLCAGDRDGTITCYATGKVAPSQFALLPGAEVPTTAPAAGSATGPAAGSTASTASPPAAAAAKLTGTIQSRAGQRLVVALDGGQAPSPGARGELSRKFEKKLGSMSFSGWLVVADVTVAKVTPGRLVLSITATRSNMTVNQKQVNHFTPGTEVKLELAP